MKFRSLDWGFARPFSVGWWAVVSDDTRVGDLVLPRGCMVRYREWYGKKSANVGLRMVVEDVAAGILERTPGETIAYTVADPAVFAEDGGPSIAERFRGAGVPMVAGDNTRLGRDGFLGGWDMLRMRLKGQAVKRPMLVVFSTCADTIRTLPMMQHDPTRAEDLLTSSEDHAVDEIRYAVMSRPWVRDPATEVDSIAEIQKPITFDDAVEHHEAALKGRRRL